MLIKVVFLIISYLRIKSYNVLNYNNCSTDWSFPINVLVCLSSCKHRQKHFCAGKKVDKLKVTINTKAHVSSNGNQIVFVQQINIYIKYDKSSQEIIVNFTYRS